MCTQKYTIAESNITLNVGDKLIIPIYSLHRDPKYYSDPEVFDPERFTEENINSRPLGTFLPFGDGPRICIGNHILFMRTYFETGTLKLYFIYKHRFAICDDGSQNGISGSIVEIPGIAM